MAESQHYQRGKVLFELQRYVDAEKEFAAALNGSADDEHAHRARALCFYHLEHRKEGRAEAEAAIGMDPEYWLNHYALAACLAGFTSAPDWPSCAEKAIQETLRRAPNDADTWALLSYLRWNECRWSEMLDAANEGLAKDPRHISCFIYRAEAFAAINALDQAEQSALSALAIDPQSSRALSIMGRIRLTQGRLPESEQYFLNALQIRPENDSAHRGMSLRRSRLRRLLQLDCPMDDAQGPMFNPSPRVGTPDTVDDVRVLALAFLGQEKSRFQRLLGRAMCLWMWLPRIFRPRGVDEITSFACLVLNMLLVLSALPVLLPLIAIPWPTLTQKEPIWATGFGLSWIPLALLCVYSSMRLRGWLYRQLVGLKWRQPKLPFKS